MGAAMIISIRRMGTRGIPYGQKEISILSIHPVDNKMSIDIKPAQNKYSP